MSSEIVITGLGVVSPIGVGCDAFRTAIKTGTSGIGRVESFDPEIMPISIGGEVTDYVAKDFVKPRKSLKVMSRDIQFAFGAAAMASQSVQLADSGIDPERLGVVFGADLIYCEIPEITDAYRDCLVEGKFDFDRWGTMALKNLYPLWMLKYLPNMLACHIGISHDARGPNNSITMNEVSSLLAIEEAMRAIERGYTDAMIVGGGSTRLHLTRVLSRGFTNLSHRNDDPAGASRPFDKDRDGEVCSEGAAVMILERKEFAERRKAPILATLRGYASCYEKPNAQRQTTGDAIRRSIAIALQDAGISADQVGYVNANGCGRLHEDAVEAQAIRDALGDVLVTAPKSFFGNTGAGTGALELAATLVGLPEREIPQTLNYQTPDEFCPVNVVTTAGTTSSTPYVLVLNQSEFGQAVALVVEAPL